jgi:phosphopantothenoylcysteine decarboxylase / phosphopantothenate---cysteine ligase
MHPSRVIRGRTTQLLAGRRIVVGVTGSIAAVEVPRIVRELIRHGADVTAVMSPDAARIISAEAIRFATGHPPILQLTGDVEHVTHLGPGEGQADLYLIAPATANTIAKIAHGIDDTPVTSFASVALGGGVPILLAPAMHAHMGANPAVRESLVKLVSWGVGIVSGASVEGEEKIASPEETAAAVLHRLAQGPWVGQRVLVVGGASRESIDAVRSVTNESSGATALAIATQAFYRGADVHLWAGALEFPIPSWIPVDRWRGVEDLLELAQSHRDEIAGARAVFVPAALSDFTLVPHPGKIESRKNEALTLTLQHAPKVLPALRSLAPPPTCLVAFKLLSGASQEELEAAAHELRNETLADWVVANDASVMGRPETNALVFPPSGERRWIRGPKGEFAGKLLDDIGRETVGIAPAVAPPLATPRRPTKKRSRRR